MKLPLFVVAAFFFFSGPAFAEGASIRINEIMYAPNDNWGGEYNEWVELLNNGTLVVTITNWTIDGKKIPEATVPAGGYAVLAKNATKFQQVYGISPVQVPFTLTNTGKNLNLADENGVPIDAFNYTPYASENLAKNNNRSLEKNASGWFESIVLGGTPGQNNSILFIAPAIQPQNSSAPGPASQGPGSAENSSSAGGASLGSPAISIISAPHSLHFGDYSSIQAQFYSGDSAFSEARVVAYVFGPHWISRELSRDDSTLRNSPYMSNAAAAIYNITVNSTVNLLLPLFLKCNKGGEFPEGNYALRVRLYKYDGSWKSVADKDTEFSVSGENPLCSAEVVYVNVTNNVTNKCPACPKQNISSSKLREEEIAFSAEVPQEVFLGDNFTANITLKNNGDARMFLEAYSYLHDHEMLLSQGFDGASWRNTWAANSRKVEIQPNESGKIALLNAPKNTTPPGAYTYRIVVSDMNSSGTLKEANYLINVKEKVKEEAPRGNIALGIAEPKNTTELTGRAVSTQAKTSFFGRIINWIKELFEV